MEFRTTDESTYLVNIACRSESTVLLTGPTGSGKTSLALKIHEQGKRRLKPFICVNLATLHEGTLESELFGHERGAFTGAEQKRVGRLELAQGGTVFLDEVGELSPRLQARLLEFLQSKTISPVGSNREMRLDVRVIAATHKDLVAAVKRGEFRADLFHRLRVLNIPLRPLCERGDEFDSIVHSCLEDLCRISGRSILRLSEEVVFRLEAYSWPGNMRELRNVLEFAVLSSDEPQINLKDLPAWFLRCASEGSESEADVKSVLGVAEIPFSLDYQGTLSSFEKEYLERALKYFRGRINQTARGIGLNKTTLIRRIRAYGIKLDLPMVAAHLTSSPS